MRKRIYAAAIIAGIALMACGCGNSDYSDDVSDTTAHFIFMDADANGDDENLETSAYPTGVPMNMGSYVKFSSPVGYTVISDADAYTDMSVTVYARTYSKGSMVVGVGTDSRYVVLDDGSVVLAENLEESK